MPSLRKRVAGFIRQLSVSPNQSDNTVIHGNSAAGSSGCFIHRYLNGDEMTGEEPMIVHGRVPQELPRKSLGMFDVGSDSVVATVTGPDDGLTTVNKKQRHLSISDPDVDYIDILDTQHAESDRVAANASTDCIFSQSYGRWFTISRNTRLPKSHPIDNSVMHIRAAGSVFSVGPKSNANSQSDMLEIGLQHCKSSSHITDNERMRQLKDYHSLKVYESEESLDVHLPGQDFSVYTHFQEFNKELNALTNLDLSVNDNGVRSNSFSETTSQNCSKVTYEKEILQRSVDMLEDPNSNTDLTSAGLVDNFARHGKLGSGEGYFNLATFDEDDFSIGEDFVIPPPAEYASSAPDNFTPLRKSKSAPSPFKNHKLGLCRQKMADNSNRVEEIAGVCDWKRPHVNAYGAAMTLYEKNPLTGENAGNPIADCFALVARKDSAVLALADGVNWGEKASVAARSAIHGCVQHLDQALYNPAVPRVANTTEVFVALLRSFHAAHSMILQEDGMLTTLTAAVVLPMAAAAADKYVVCVCNVGDSLAYVYSTRHGVREITKGSHDIHCMRDMRDALGALGPVDGQNPELNNLTCSMTEIDAGDIVFLTSDGVSDNFDPVVGKFAVLPANGSPTSLRPSQKTNPGTIEIHVRGSSNVYGSANSGRNQQGSGFADVASFAGNQTKLAAGPSSGNRSRRNQWTKPMSNFNKAKMNVSDFSFTSTLPTVQAFQRHELSLLRMDDLLRHGVSGNGPPCDNAQSLCEMLLDFATRLTAAKRHILEDADLYLEPDETAENGVKELSKAEQRSRRKKVLDKLQMVPGKLDHASVVAYKAGFGGTDEAPIRETKI